MTGRYQAYSKYHPTNDVHVKKLPIDWVMKPLGLVAAKGRNSFVDGPFGSDLKSNEYQDEGIPLIQLNNITIGKHILQNMKYITEEKMHQLSRHIAKPNDIVIAKMADPVARATVVNDKFEKYVIVADCVKLTVDTSIVDLNYVIHAINSKEVNSSAELVSTGTTRIRINLTELKNLKIPFPPLAVQQKIANFLDHETAKIDTLIAKQEKLIELLKEKRQAVISHAVTRGLNPNTPMKDSGVEWLGKVPRHWKASKLKNYTTQIVDGAHFTPTYTETGVPFLRVTDVTSKTIDFNKIKYIPESEHKDLIKRCNPQKGDLLLSKNGTIGVPKVINWDYEFSIFVSLCLIKFKPELLSKYAFYVFKSYQIAEQINSGIKQSTVINLHLDKIENFYFSIPPIEEQKQIIIELERKTLKLDTLVNKAIAAIELMKERKTALISAAVTGKIDVRNYNTEKAGN